jgi:hypothetical protein
MKMKEQAYLESLERRGIIRNIEGEWFAGNLRKGTARIFKTSVSAILYTDWLESNPDRPSSDYRARDRRTDPGIPVGPRRPVGLDAEVRSSVKGLSF